MATAVDFSSGLGSIGFIPYELMEGSQAQAYDVDSEMTDVSEPTDAQGGGAVEIVSQPTEHVSFSEMIESVGASVLNVGGTSQEPFNSAPAVYKMRGWSSTLGQYVHWRSHGDALTPPPAEYGTVINVSSELVQ